MKDWLIKLLGGYTLKEYTQIQKKAADFEKGFRSKCKILQEMKLSGEEK